MIRIEKVRVREFRGIRDLTLDLKAQNFAACGPNGTGKSGILDAIEFALTGNISRLSGGGTGGLSVKAHGPHVDSRNKPDKAFVTLEVVIPALGGKRASIHRTVKAAGAPVITPGDEDVRAAFERVGLRVRTLTPGADPLCALRARPAVQGGAGAPTARRHRKAEGGAAEVLKRLRAEPAVP